MKNINIFKNIYLLLAFIMLTSLSAIAETEVEVQNLTSNIVNTNTGRSMIFNDIENIAPVYRNLIIQSGLKNQSINLELDELKSFAIEETKDTKKLEQAIKNTNNEAMPIGPSVINPQKTFTLDDIDDFDDSENSGIKVKVLSKEKPAM